ncbi:hypothetical protein BN1708_004506 [Verticillium longisporum]|uniref:Uncharacterized protein n=1 Tax=Verticillium longisporum TaxID=100787 RepID=A0A0G4M1Y6_VERLO|nr:hypothetical protein BN1708_004506 [Verticillium longisporum]
MPISLSLLQRLLLNDAPEKVLSDPVCERQDLEALVLDSRLFHTGRGYVVTKRVSALEASLPRLVLAAGNARL